MRREKYKQVAEEGTDPRLPAPRAVRGTFAYNHQFMTCCYSGWNGLSCGPVAHLREAESESELGPSSIPILLDTTLLLILLHYNLFVFCLLGWFLSLLALQVSEKIMNTLENFGSSGGGQRLLCHVLLFIELYKYSILRTNC